MGKTKNQLVVGLDKVNSTAEQVAVMRLELAELQPVLQQTAEDVGKMMTEIAVDKASAEVTKPVVERRKFRDRDGGV